MGTLGLEIQCMAQGCDMQDQDLGFRTKSA